MGTPADVVKARVMNQPTDEFGRGLVYKSSVDCAMQTIKGEGFLGKRLLFNGCVCLLSNIVSFYSTLQGLCSLLATYGSMVFNLLAFI